MLSDKTSLINYLKSIKTKQQIHFDQFLVIVHENSITLHESRRFLIQKNIERCIDWKQMAFEEILELTDDSHRYIISNRPYWLQQRRLYQTGLLKFHELCSKMTQQDQEYKRKSKLQLLQQLREQKGRQYEIFKRSLDEQDFSQLVLQLSVIVEFQQQANSYIFPNDYESNQVINKCLEELNQKKLNESVIKSHLKKHSIDSPMKKIKTSPGELTKSKSIGQLKGKNGMKFSLARNNSEKAQIFHKDRKNFIHQIREEIRKQQMRSSLARSISENQSKNSIGSNRLVSINLPKILKLSDEALSSQGIYKSLKKFANFDYVAQEKKIRDIIGISLGEEQEFMSAYFNRQRSVKQQKQFQQHTNRQQRRRKILEGLAKKQHHHCKRYNPEEVQPYMRF